MRMLMAVSALYIFTNDERAYQVMLRLVRRELRRRG